MLIPQSGGPLVARPPFFVDTQPESIPAVIRITLQIIDDDLPEVEGDDGPRFQINGPRESKFRSREQDDIEGALKVVRARLEALTGPQAADFMKPADEKKPAKTDSDK